MDNTVAKLVVSPENLGVLEHTRQRIQRHRIQMTNRISAVEDGRSSVDTAIIEHLSERFQTLEDEITQLATEAVRDHEMWPWLKAVKGIGPTLAGALVSHIDIARPNSVSGLWRYAGQGVNNSTGLRDRPTKGEKLPYNAELKRLCYVIASAFMRSNSPYRIEYDEKRAYYEEFRTDWTKAHIDAAAKRSMIKLFLEHLFTLWRYEKNLPILPPYAIGQLKHFHVKPPWDYVPNYQYPQAIIEHYQTMGQHSRNQQVSG